jgi:hypothetical protein
MVQHIRSDQPSTPSFKYACMHALVGWGKALSIGDPDTSCEAPHLGYAALHDEEVRVVHVQLHRLEHVSNTPAKEGRSSTDTSMCVSRSWSGRDSKLNQVIQHKEHRSVSLCAILQGHCPGAAA